jgi:hypothetical protein
MYDMNVFLHRYGMKNGKSSSLPVKLIPEKKKIITVKIIANLTKNLIKNNLHGF